MTEITREAVERLAGDLLAFHGHARGGEASAVILALRDALDYSESEAVGYGNAVEDLQAKLDKAEEEKKEHEHSFDLHWKASMRAIKRWQEATPGNDLVWPDAADLQVWLLDKLARAERERDEALEAFKNFHRMLCERFDCAHDERDWQRDQVSLMEHIAREREEALEALSKLANFPHRGAITAAEMRLVARAILAKHPLKD